MRLAIRPVLLMQSVRAINQHCIRQEPEGYMGDDSAIFEAIGNKGSDPFLEATLRWRKHTGFELLLISAATYFASMVLDVDSKFKIIAVHVLKSARQDYEIPDFCRYSSAIFWITDMNKKRNT